MTSINLLPWREKFRAQEKQRFLLLCILAICFVAIIDIFWSVVLQTNIGKQNERNQILQKEIKQAETNIKKKTQFESEKAEILSKITTLMELNNQRFRLIELISVLPKLMPNATYITSISVKKNTIELTAQAPTDVQASELVKKMRQQAGWKNINLLEIQSEKNTQFRISFNIE